MRGGNIQSVATVKYLFIKIWKSSFCIWRLSLISLRSQNFIRSRGPCELRHPHSVPAGPDLEPSLLLALPCWLPLLVGGSDLCRPVAQLCLTLIDPQTAARQASLSFTISCSFLKLMSTESVMPSNHLILCHPLLLLPSVFPSIRVCSSELALHIRWKKYWSFSFSIVLPMTIQGWFPLGLTGLISLLSKGLSICQSSWSLLFFTRKKIWSQVRRHLLL